SGRYRWVYRPSAPAAGAVAAGVWQRFRNMPECRAEPRVVARPQPGDPRLDGTVHGLVEPLAGLHEHTVAPPGREGIDGRVVAARIEAPRQRDQRLAPDVDDLPPGHVALRRARSIEQDGNGEIALLAAARDIDAVGVLARRRQ